MSDVVDIALLFEGKEREALAAYAKGENYEWTFKLEGKHIIETVKTPKPDGLASRLIKKGERT